MTRIRRQSLVRRLRWWRRRQSVLSVRRFVRRHGRSRWVARSWQTTHSEHRLSAQIKPQTPWFLTPYPNTTSSDFIRNNQTVAFWVTQGSLQRCDKVPCSASVARGKRACRHTWYLIWISQLINDCDFQIVRVSRQGRQGSASATVGGTVLFYITRLCFCLCCPTLSLILSSKQSPKQPSYITINFFVNLLQLVKKKTTFLQLSLWQFIFFCLIYFILPVFIYL